MVVRVFAVLGVTAFVSGLLAFFADRNEVSRGSPDAQVEWVFAPGLFSVLRYAGWRRLIGVGCACLITSAVFFLAAQLIR